jgi:hypothetical protein
MRTDDRDDLPNPNSDGKDRSDGKEVKRGFLHLHSAEALESGRPYLELVL